MKNYWVIMTTRNRAKILDSSLQSLYAQSVPPRHIIIFDDGSNPPADPVRSQSVPLTVLRREDEGYDIRRVVKNWNACLSFAIKNSFIDSSDFVLISGDDCSYPHDYAEQLITKMASGNVDVASGSRGLKYPPDGWKPPEGSGRMVSHRLLRLIGNQFPEQCGYESWLVYEALRRGLRVACYSDLSYDHLASFGVGSHRFVEWGHMGHTLGYDPVFFVARWVKNLAVGDIPRRSIIRILMQYFRGFVDRPNNGFYKPFAPEFRAFVARTQRRRLMTVLLGRVSKRSNQN